MIKVLFFAQLRDQLGTAELSLSSDENPDVGTLLDNLKARDPLWHKHLSQGTVMVAVNQVISQKSASLSSGDEVAFFPPVTGG